MGDSIVVKKDTPAPTTSELGGSLATATRELAETAAASVQETLASVELTERDAAIAGRINFVAKLMDNAVQIPGTDFRLGLDPILGLIPGWGDWISAMVSIYILIEAIRLGAPTDILTRMAGNIALDLTVGLIPGLGDVFDAVFKANAKNAAIVHNEVLGLAPAVVKTNDLGEVIEMARPQIRIVRRERTPMQRAVGYSLVAGLVSLFLLPWAVFAYFAFS